MVIQLKQEDAVSLVNGLKAEIAEGQQHLMAHKVLRTSGSLSDLLLYQRMISRAEELNVQECIRIADQDVEQQRVVNQQLMLRKQDMEWQLLKALAKVPPGSCSFFYSMLHFA